MDKPKGPTKIELLKMIQKIDNGYGNSIHILTKQQLTKLYYDIKKRKGIK